MKNIHVIPTDKPSRLHNSFNILRLEKAYELSPCNLNIYITSDEEIDQQTKPCWCINTIKNTWKDNLIYYQGSMPQYHYKGLKKIILTTDQDLINDGVQKIDDEFLEWFVKNPNCEEVEITKVADLDLYYKNGIGGQKYKIIIPKEEAKPFKDMLPMAETDLAEFKKNPVPTKKETLEEVLKKIKSVKLCLMAHPNNEVDSEFADRITDLEEIQNELSKAKWQQETLEEAAERIVNSTRLKNPKSLFCEGAKWQQEQIGKSEFLQKLRGTLSDAEARRLILEQFKKK